MQSSKKLSARLKHFTFPFILLYLVAIIVSLLTLIMNLQAIVCIQELLVNLHLKPPKPINAAISGSTPPSSSTVLSSSFVAR